MNTQNKISVYLVDDNELFISTLAIFLNECFKSEIEISKFSTGEDSLKKIQENPKATADVVILDYHLNTESKEAMNGIDILKKIKEINRDIVVVMLSAEDKLSIATECIKYGAYEYVVKSETALIRAQNSIKNSMEKELNSKILKITMIIMEKYPELSKYIEEMQETIPNENNPEITLNNLRTYYDSLHAVLNKYIVDHSPLLAPKL